MVSAPRIAIKPVTTPQLDEAVRTGGGEPVEDATTADGIVWINPGDPKGLRTALTGSAAHWIQLPFAGIESFVAAGVIDPDRTWTCAKGIYGHACAEHALALMLAAARRIHHHVRARGWVEPGFGSPERRLHGTTTVVFGTGGIGGALVPMLQPLAARIVAVNRSGKALEGAERTVTTAELPTVLAEADFVVLAAALTPKTDRLFGAELLARMKPDAWIVNVARGRMIDTDALVAALTAGAIGGAALDVTDPEPLPEEHPLWALDNAIVTPHVANTWDMGLPELVALVARNVAHLAAGEELEGLVDPERGY